MEESQVQTIKGIRPTWKGSPQDPSGRQGGEIVRTGKILSGQGSGWVAGRVAGRGGRAWAAEPSA